MKTLRLYLIVIAIILSSCAGLKPLEVQEINLKNLIAKTCLNFEGKSRIELSPNRFVGGIESLLNSQGWKMILSFPFYGEELMELDWSQYDSVGLIIKGGMKQRLINGFKEYLEKKNLQEDPGLIMTFVGHLGVVLKHIDDLKKQGVQSCISQNNSSHCKIAMPRKQGFKNINWIWTDQDLTGEISLDERFKLTLHFTQFNGKYFSRITTSLKNQKADYFNQDIFISSCSDSFQDNLN